jgi:hypothetical protein
VGIEKQPSLWTAERKRKLLLLVETSVSWTFCYMHMNLIPICCGKKKKKIFHYHSPALLPFSFSTALKPGLSVGLSFLSTAVESGNRSGSSSPWPNRWQISETFCLSSFYLSGLRHMRLEIISCFVLIFFFFF